MTAKKILVINLGWEQEPLISKIFAAGLKVYGVHYNDQYNKDFAYEEVQVSDLRDLVNILEFAERIQPDYVISDECDYSNFAQALVAERFGLPGPSIEQAQVSINKLLQRRKASEAGVLVPGYSLITCIDDVHDFLKQFPLPIILKPIDNRGSFGVVKVEKEADIPRAYETALVNSHSRLVLAEEFIDGYEITVDGYCFEDGPHSLSLAKKNKGGLKVQVSMDIKYPGDIPVDVYEKAMHNNEFVNRSLGYVFGMTHSEYMIDAKDRIYLMESANRGGGVFTSELIAPAVSGMPLMDLLLQDVTGKPQTPFPSGIQKNNVILKFFSFPEGKIKKIEGTEKVTAHPSVLQFRIAVKENDNIRPIENDGNRHGFVIVQSDRDVRSLAEEIINNINIIYY